MPPPTLRRPRPAFALPPLPHTTHVSGVSGVSRVSRVSCVPRAPPSACCAADPSRVVVRLPRPLGVSLAENRAARVVVAAVAPDGPADGLVRVGDVVVALAGAPARSLARVVDAIQTTPDPHVTLELEREVRPSETATVAAAAAAESTEAAAGAADARREEGAAADFYTKQEERLEQLLAAYVQQKGKGGEREKQLLADLLEEGADVVRSRVGTDARSAQLILSVVYKMRRAGVPVDLKLFNIIMWSLVQAGAAGKAVELFKEIEAPNVECYTTLVKAYSMLRKPDEAIALLPLMRSRGVKPNIRTYNGLIASCVRGGKLAKARQLFSEMLVDGVSPNVVSWNIIINWHVQQKTGSRRLQDALAAFEDMKASGVRPNVVTFTTLMKAYTKSGLLNKAEEVFAEIKLRLPAKLDTSVYNTMMRAYAVKLDWRRCLELLDEMNGVGVTDDLWGSSGASRSLSAPTSHNFEEPSHSRSYSKRRPWLADERDGNLSYGEGRPETLSVASAKKRTSLTDTESRCQPDAVTYSLVVKVCASAGRPELARELFDEMMDDGFFPPPLPAVVSLMSGYAKAGMLTESFKVLKNLKAWSVFPDEKVLSSLMHGCLVAKQPSLALSVYEKYKTGKFEADVVILTLLLEAYGMSGELDKAFDVVRGMRKPTSKQRPSIVTYNVLIESSLMHGRCDWALEALDLLLSDKAVISKIDRNTFHSIVGITAPTDSSLTWRQPSGDSSNSNFDDAPLYQSEDGGQNGGREERYSNSDDVALGYLMDALRRLREAGVSPNGTLYHALLATCEACDNWALGAKLLREKEDGKFVVGRKDRTKELRILEDLFRARSVSRPTR